MRKSAIMRNYTPAHRMKPLDSLSACQAFFAEFSVDQSYLSHHYPRFDVTRRELHATRSLAPGSAVLDVGAHWLHQAALYATDGMRVTALDLSLTMADPGVAAAAAAIDIRLLANDDLEHIPALEAVADNSFELVLFTEIIEHITFNPVAMWRELYRVLKPGARIVVTTPNYYAIRGRLWNPRRPLFRSGGGITVSDILEMHTYAHHWKEYSLRELVAYFRRLSPDFDCIKAKHMPEYAEGYNGTPAKWLVRQLERYVPILRPNLHFEVLLREKASGIVVEPSW